MQILKHESLKKHTSFHVGGNQDIYVPENIEEFKKVLTQYPDVFILGGGTKLLFPDHAVKSTIVATQSLDKISETAEGIRVQAGARLAQLFDFVAGVAATAGGAVRNNYGAFGFELGAFVEKVRIISAKEDRWVEKKDLHFAYRTSSLKDNNSIIAEVVFLKKQLENKTLFLQKRKEKQPLGLFNAGSIFKNPAGGETAGSIIEGCGLKGEVCGDAMVWDKHANFIVNRGNATAADIKTLIKKVYNTVKEKKGIILELELEVLGGIDGF